MIEASPDALTLTAPGLSIRPARFSDYERISRLERTFCFKPTPYADWEMLWVASPLWRRLGAHWPIGWVLESSTGEIVGSMGNIPLLYHFRGEELIAASGRGWGVVPQFRAFALWLLEERFDQKNVDLFIDTSINSNSLDAFETFSNRVPAGDWEVSPYCVVDYHKFAARASQKLHVPLAPALRTPAAAALRLGDALFFKKRKGAPALDIAMVERFDSRFDAFWDELRRQNSEMLLAARDAATLSWHFSIPIRRRRIWVFTASHKQQLRAYCILKRQDDGSGLPRMRLIDYQAIDSDGDLLPVLLQAALAKCASEGICILDKPGAGLRKTRAFDAVAPYRQRQNWPAFYRATNDTLAQALRDERVWDISEYDGDASIE
ncbi:MAG: hypothetical protein JO193_06730 [Candidatus Eremiobacteraeota bacterium]|nr:hypothetical protein [Candidatus Eremiobacteraeota bacterium]